MAKFKTNKTLKEAVSLIDNNYRHVLEFGVYKGGTLTQLRKDLDDSYKLFGFDSFSGLPEEWSGTKHKKGDLTTKGKIPEIQGTKIYPGWFTDTVKDYKNIAEPIALLHCDADLYSSTVTILYELNSYILPGTIIVFDEWYYNHKDIEQNRQHEQKAFYEWVEDKNREFELVDEIEEERRIVKIIK